MTCSDAQKANKPALIQSDLFSIFCTLACVALFIMLGSGSKGMNGSTSGAGYIMFFCACCCCCSCLTSAMDLSQVMVC